MQQQQQQISRESDETIKKKRIAIAIDFSYQSYDNTVYDINLNLEREDLIWKEMVYWSNEFFQKNIFNLFIYLFVF